MSNPYKITNVSAAIVAVLVAQGFDSLEKLRKASDRSIKKVLGEIDGCNSTAVLKAIRKATHPPEAKPAPDAGKLSDEDIARIVHDEMRDDTSDAWEKVSHAEQAKAAEFVHHILGGEHTPESDHALWLEHMHEEGWTYGEAYDEDAKTNPDLVAYGDVPDDERARKELFFAKVHALQPRWVGLPAAPVEKETLPCPHCTAGRHPKFGHCPHCDGSGVKDEEEAVQADEPVAPGSLAGRDLGELNLHELRAVAKLLGIPHIATASIGQMREEFESFRLAHGQDGRAAIARAIHIAEPEIPDGLWQFDETVPGVMDAIDPEGWFTAAVHKEGSVVVTLLGHPNLHNRVGGNSAHDVTIEAPNLAGLIQRLQALNNAANLTFADAGQKAVEVED